MSTRPIGIFDSGIGGLSVLRALLEQLPLDSFDYIADSANAPYGEREPGFIVERSLACASRLIVDHRCKALVVACNSATSAAIDNIREHWPEIPIIGIEPPLKPAANLTRTRRIAVMATKATLDSPKFAALTNRLPTNVVVYRVPCDGLALSIEEGDLVQAEAIARDRLRESVGGYDQLNLVDCIALGCTHYPLVAAAISRVAPHAHLFDPALGTALRCKDLLAKSNLSAPTEHRPAIAFHISGDIESFRKSASLHLPDHSSTSRFTALQS